MGKLVVTEFVTLDGVAQAPGGPDEDRDGDFPYGGWQGPLGDQASGEAIFAKARTMDALLLGRKTYESFADYWPSVPQEVPFSALLNRVPKYVASRTLRGPLAWDGSEVLDGDLAELVTEVKERHAEVHVIGSLDLVQSLLRLGLVDRLHLWQYPVVLGTGKRVFAEGTDPTSLRLIESIAHANGPLQVTYEIAGPPLYAALDADEGEAEPSP